MFTNQLEHLWWQREGLTHESPVYKKVFLKYFDMCFCRFAKYQEMSAKGIVDPSKLPPTESSANEHTMRVYFQCLVWKTLSQFPADPSTWGWKIEDGVYVPVQSSMECAPSDLLQFIRCKCKSGCTSNL